MNMIQLNKIGICSSRGSFDGELSIKSEKYNALSEEQKSELRWNAGQHLTDINEKINLIWSMEYEEEKRKEHAQRLIDLFNKAGFTTIYIEVIESGYGSGSYYYSRPWVRVTTHKGVIVVGWRKSVINIDWEKSDIKASGDDLFSGENTSRGYHYVHCDSEDKAVEYLNKLLLTNSQ